MAWRCAVGFASSNGAIGRMGHGAKKYAVVFVLSALDFFLFEMGGRRNGCLHATAGAAQRPPLLDAVQFVSVFFHPGDPQQAFCGDAPVCARPLHLVDEKKNPLARCVGAGPVCPGFSASECMDDLGTEISRARGWTRLGPDFAGTFQHRGSGYLVLSQ